MIIIVKGGAPLLRAFGRGGRIKDSFKQKTVNYNFAYFPVLFDKEVFGKSRDEVADWLWEHGIGAKKVFLSALQRI